VILFVPAISGTVDAVHVVLLQEPDCAAMPLPPRSLTQVTRSILRSSLAEPAIFSVATAVA
jgi:hypothetical protein